MDDRDDGPLEALLRRRAAPDAPADLSARIISQARDLPQEQARPAGVWHWLVRMVDEIGDVFAGPSALLRPALALAVVLLMGAVVGVLIQESTEVYEEDYIFLYMEDPYGVEDWL